MLKQVVDKTISIDPKLNHLLDSWTNGNRSYVVGVVSQCSPHIACMLIVELSRTDQNILTNMLFDKHLEIWDNGGNNGS